MIPFLPHQISTKAIAVYLLTIAMVTLLFFRYAMPIEYMVMGIVWVTLFFGLVAWISHKTYTSNRRRYVEILLLTALVLRVVWVIFSYFFYQSKTGIPFEFESADAIDYHYDSAWLATTSWRYTWDYLIGSRTTLSDSGYFLYLTTLYRIIGPNILLARLIKALIGTATCWLIYRLAARTMSESTGRLAGLMAACMPNLIIYCGLHLKETEMIFLTIAFLERTDALLRNHQVSDLKSKVKGQGSRVKSRGSGFRCQVSGVAPLLLGLTLFTFRTVLGAVALLAFVSAVLLTSNTIVQRRKKLVIGVWVAVTLAILASSTIATETEGYWTNRHTNQQVKREQQSLHGNNWAQYATGTVMAPMMFVLPFPTMIDVEQQYNQNIMHGGNSIRNLLGGFVVIALINAFFGKKDWRNKVLIGSFMIAYLTVIAMSGFANSERFLLPGLPLLLIFAADGVATLNAKNYRFIKIWYWIVPTMAIAWAYFKIGSRGLFI